MSISIKKCLDFIPEYARLPLFLAPIWNCLAYYGGRALADGLPHGSFSLSWDAEIPLVPWSTAVYFLSFLFWTVNYFMAARRDKASAVRFFYADFLTRLVSFFCFVFLPTSMTRPTVTGSSFWSEMLRLLYRIDAADNLFPSIHCAASVLSALGIHGERRIHLWYRIVSWFIAGVVCISTLTTKQHVLADVIGGVTLAFAAYWAAGSSAEKLF